MMDTFNYGCYPSAEHLSVEVNSDGYTFLSDQYDTTYDPDMNSLFNCDPFAMDINSINVCESTDLVATMNCPAEPNEFDKYLGPGHSSSSTYDIDQNMLAINNLPVYGTVEKPTKRKSNKKAILLSPSVGVGISQLSLKRSPKIEIVNELEETYRPRYKSDYFAQNGKNRKPRYVADRDGNHCITLKVPPGTRGRIRVDWVTIPDDNGERYFMPYRFQASNESADVPDVNPIMTDIVLEASGTEIKLYLVLIKAKQDALKSVQPLRPYHPIKDIFGIVDKHSSEKMGSLTPKKLIRKYQLGKSQLAFTLCPLSSDGQTCITEWDTTAFSTVLEEEAADNPAGQTIACPSCSTPINIDEDGIVIPAATKKRKSLHMGNKRVQKMKKENSASKILYYVN